MNAESSMPRSARIFSPCEKYSAISILQFHTKALHSNSVQKEANATGINQASGLQQDDGVLARSQGMHRLGRTRQAAPESLLPFHGALLPPDGLTQACKNGTGKGAFFETSCMSLKPLIAFAKSFSDQCLFMPC